MDESDKLDFEPAFLNPEKAEELPYIGDTTVPTFDSELELMGELKPARSIEERWRAVARLHALGQTNKDIGVKVGYSATNVGVILNNKWVQDEVLRFRESFETDILTKVKEAALDGINRIHRIVLDEQEKTTTVLDASKWLIEKTTGKARQEVNVESNTLTNFMEVLRQMSNRGETIDVTDTAQEALPEAQENSSKWENWSIKD